MKSLSAISARPGQKIERPPEVPLQFHCNFSENLAEYRSAPSSQR